jgi:pyrimidine operon attenuation protein / uracil phosphoribosyltransferase
MSLLQLDAEALYAELRTGVGRLLAEHPGSVLVGIASGGAWLAQRLHADLGLPGSAGVITSTLHRDDYGHRGLAGGVASTMLPAAVDGAHIVLVDDVLHTGRTLRAVLNELYDYGRPARVRLAVLVDRGGRELPVAADFAAATLRLPAEQRLALARDPGGLFTFALESRS